MSPPDAGDDDPGSDASSDPDSGDPDPDACPSADPDPDAINDDPDPDTTDDDRASGGSDAANGDPVSDASGSEGAPDDGWSGEHASEAPTEADRSTPSDASDPSQTDRSTVSIDESGAPPVAENGGRPTDTDGSRRGGQGVDRTEREPGPPPATGTEAAHDAAASGGWASFAYDVVSSVGAVLVVGLLLFAVSGVWPPMVAVTSESMTPHMEVGDLVFVMDEERFPGEGAHGDTGVVTYRAGDRATADYAKFGRPGDVIVYERDGRNQPTMIIHRAMFWVNESENWYDEADRQSVGRYEECGDTPEEALPNCPAPHAGFVTKGDANERYDQVGTPPLSGPVKPKWVVGTAEARVPKLGCIRLRSEQCVNGLLGSTLPSADASAMGRACPCNRTT